MSSPADPAGTLTEISHLFLSSVRERQMDGAARPTRIPPGAPRMESSRPSHSIDLSPEEFASEFPAPSADMEIPAPEMDPAKPLAIVLGSHFGADYRERVYSYVRYLARSAGRVGLLFADDSAIELSCFDRTDETGIEPETVDDDVETFVSVLNELNHDVNRWVIATMTPRGLFEQPRTAILLAGCDHEGVIEAYRTLKGLTGFCPENVGVALFEARDLRDAQRVHRKLASVADQFLGCSINLAAIVIPTQGINRHPLASIPVADAAWAGIADFFATAPAAAIIPESAAEAAATPKAAEPKTPEPVKAAPVQEMRPAIEPIELDSEPIQLHPDPIATPAPRMAEVASAPAIAAETRDVSDVLDLPSGCADEDGILSAMVRNAGGAMIECPVRPPMLNGCRMVVDRQRRLLLMAVATQGLSDLQTIATAYRWLSENRSLVAMALPQMNIDAHALPQLRLLIDHHDASATTLQTLLQSGCVQLQTYRKLRWGGKTGLLLEAA